MSAAFILIGGKIGDLIGRKRAYVIGLCRELAQQGQLPKVNPLVGVAFAFAQTRALLSLMRESAFSSVRADTWLRVARSTVVCGLEALATA